MFFRLRALICFWNSTRFTQLIAFITQKHGHVCAHKPFNANRPLLQSNEATHRPQIGRNDVAYLLHVISRASAQDFLICSGM